jgi:uncharacterized DUF497 family protein
MGRDSFEWDPKKNAETERKHGVSFFTAQFAFSGPQRFIAKDNTHRTAREERFFCFGKVKPGVVTVRFTYRNNVICIFGAGYWRKGKRIYERQTKIQ